MEHWPSVIPTILLGIIAWFIRAWKSAIEAQLEENKKKVDDTRRHLETRLQDIERRIGNVELAEARVFHLPGTVEAVERRLEEGNKLFASLGTRLTILETRAEK